MPAELQGNLFLCIGAQKSGTSWLHHCLRHHPGIWLAPIKEMHYFDEVHCGGGVHWIRLAALRAQLERLENPRSLSETRLERLKWTTRACFSEPRNDDWYVRLMSAGAGHDAYGEITPAYATLPEEGFRHIRTLAPQAKLLFIMRDPVERTWSQLRMEAARQGDRSLLATETVLALLEGGGPYWNRTDYRTTIRTVRTVFPPEQIRFLFYEDLVADARGFLGAVLRYLGVTESDEVFAASRRRQHVTPERSMPLELRHELLARFAPIVDEVRILIGRVPSSWEGLEAG